MTKIPSRLRTILGVSAWLVLATALSSLWIARAQQGDAGPRFTGTSTSLEAEGLRISRRHFEAGARSAWHSHPGGQLLFVEQGRARTQKRGQAMLELETGDSNYTGPNVEHWHGATPDSEFVQVAVGFGPGIEWLDLVTDDEYNGR